MVSALHFDGYRHLRIKFGLGFLAGLKQFKFQTASQPGLVDVGQQAVHLRSVRQLLEHGPKTDFNVGHLLLVARQVDGDGFFVGVDRA